MKQSHPSHAPGSSGSPVNVRAVLIADERAIRASGQRCTEEEVTLLKLIDGKRTVAEILQQSGLSGFVAMRRLRSLFERRLIHGAIVQAAPPGPAESRNVGVTQDIRAAVQVLRSA